MSRFTEILGSTLDRTGLLRLAVTARRRHLWPYKGLTVLLYHRIVDPTAVGELDPEMVDATPEEFDAQMAYVKQVFRPVALEDVLEARAGGRPLPPDSVLITFDDGYLDNFQNALPILQKHGMKALFFIPTGYITDRPLFWWEQVSLLVGRSKLAKLRIDYPTPLEVDISTPQARRSAARRLNGIIKEYFDLDLDRFLDSVAAGAEVPWSRADARALGDATLMTWDHVKKLREAGMGIGSHGHRHRGMLTLKPDDLVSDIRTSRSMLEGALGERITTIAYPFGQGIATAPAPKHAVVEAGFDFGFTTIAGLNRVESGYDSLAMHRLPVDRILPTSLARLWMTFPFLAS
jgi:peptidoglycan/xylan/chitin deacetylase (PgdA/CDA1 family)